MHEHRIDMIADKRMEFVRNDNSVKAVLHLSVKPHCQKLHIHGHYNGEETYSNLTEYWYQRLRIDKETV